MRRVWAREGSWFRAPTFPVPQFLLRRAVQIEPQPWPFPVSGRVQQVFELQWFRLFPSHPGNERERQTCCANSERINSPEFCHSDSNNPEGTDASLMGR